MYLTGEPWYQLDNIINHLGVLKVEQIWKNLNMSNSTFYYLSFYLHANIKYTVLTWFRAFDKRIKFYDQSFIFNK